MREVAFTAPHADATRIGMTMLREGASAVDAMIAAAAAIAVLYPHMNSLGGDGFWLLQAPGQPPEAIDASGFSAALADMAWYRQRELHSVPARGGPAALCMGGTLDGWREARMWARETGASLQSLAKLLAPAITLARQGIKVTASLQAASAKVQPELRDLVDYQRIFCPAGRVLQAGEHLLNPGLAVFLEQLARDGTDSFYRGELAQDLASWLAAAGSPLRLDDFNSYRARRLEPLSVGIEGAQLYNLSAPTQGVASLLILAIYDVLSRRSPVQDEVQRVHLLVEATKQAFLVRDREVTDPSRLSSRWSDLLSPQSIEHCAQQVSLDSAQSWPALARPGDTVWMGAVDAQGCMVSFIQSIYWEFGSGLVHPRYGLVWNNRGMSFSLQANHPNSLAPRHKPLHTLNPAMALFADGRRMVYGTMGGEGQPQTQAALFSRYHYQGVPLAQAIADGRWLLGRTWGERDQDLKLEQDLYMRVGPALAARGHALRPVPVHSELMGHAGALVLDASGRIEAASDPRSDGLALVDRVIQHD